MSTFPPTQRTGQWAGLPSTPRSGNTVPELIRKSLARVSEKFDFSKTKHIPPTILRQEVRRLLEQFLEAEAPNLARIQRDAMIEDVLNEVLGFGPLETLFKDPAIREILILNGTLIVVRKDQAWMPTHVRFRDQEQYLASLQRWRHASESLLGVEGVEATGVYRLRNGFRLVVIAPPAILEHPTLVVLTRENGGHGSSIVNLATVTPEPTEPHLSGSMTKPASGTIQNSGRYPLPPSPSLPRPVPAPDSGTDPHARLKQRVSSWVISRCADAGVFDVSQIPAAELKKVMRVHIQELCQSERIQLGADVIDRIVQEVHSQLLKHA